MVSRDAITPSRDAIAFIQDAATPSGDAVAFTQDITTPFGHAVAFLPDATLLSKEATLSFQDIVCFSSEQKTFIEVRIAFSIDIFIKGLNIAFFPCSTFLQEKTLGLKEKNFTREAWRTWRATVNVSYRLFVFVFLLEKSIMALIKKTISPRRHGEHGGPRREFRTGFLCCVIIGEIFKGLD